MKTTPKTPWHWEYGLLAIATTNILFLLCLQYSFSLATGLTHSEWRNFSIMVAFYVAAVPVVFWLFSHPKDR